MRLPYRLLTLTSATVFLVGCAVNPSSFGVEEYSEMLRGDRDTWMSAMEPVTEVICLDEAIARALKYNLDHRVYLLEQVQASSELRAGRFDMLPRLMANAGYHWRDEENIRDSIDSVTGLPSLANPSISSERERTTADLTLSWSILDFGLGYYNARQNADRLLVANERRRRAMHILMQEVTTAYWRALAAQKLEGDVRHAIREAELALGNSREILNAQLSDPTETLRYQRNLLENLRLLESVQRELSAAKIELTRLMGLLPGTELGLIEPGRAVLRPIETDIETLETIALSNNADLREQSYNTRIAAQETRKTLLRMMPGLNFSYGINYDSDTYLINQQWQQASLGASYNLLNLLSAPAHRAASQHGLEVAEARRMAVQMVVLSQLHLAKHHYHDALRQFERAESIYIVDRHLSELALSQERTQMGSPLERISRDVTRILSSVRMYQAMARVNEASGQIQTTLGLEPNIGSLDEASLASLRREIIHSYAQMDIGIDHQWQCGSLDRAGALPVATVPAVTPLPVQVLPLDAALLFDFNSSELRPQAHAALDELLETLKAIEGVEHIEIVGHTDSIGSAQANQALSRQRAESVLTHLLERDMRSPSVVTRGAGFDEPVASNETREGRQQNRRVEIHVHHAPTQEHPQGDDDV